MLNASLTPPILLIRGLCVSVRVRIATPILLISSFKFHRTEAARFSLIQPPIGVRVRVRVSVSPFSLIKPPFE